MIQTVLCFVVAVTTTQLKVEIGDDGVAFLAKYPSLERLTITGPYDDRW